MHPAHDHPPAAVPYRIRTERLWLRCWNPADAQPLIDALAASLEELKVWMPWAWNETQVFDDKVAFLRTRRAEFDSDGDYHYGIFDAEERKVLGAVGLHRRVGLSALELGYWIHSGRTGQGLATEAGAALVRVAFDIHGVDRLDLHCDPGNVASSRIAHKLGFVQEATLRRRYRMQDGELRDTQVFSMHREEYGQTPLARQELELYGAAGERVFL